MKCYFIQTMLFFKYIFNPGYFLKFLINYAIFLTKTKPTSFLKKKKKKKKTTGE